MQKSLAGKAVCWIAAIAFAILQASAGLAPAQAIAVPHGPVVSDTMDCKTCAPMPAASGSCAAGFCLSANIKQEATPTEMPGEPAFDVVSMRVPGGHVARPPIRPA